MPAGRPTKFNPLMIDQVLSYQFRKGATITEICELLGVPYKMVYDWMTAYPDFREAVALARAVQDDDVETSMYHRAKGGVVVWEDRAVGKGQVMRLEKLLPADVEAGFNWLYNRRPDKWSRRQDVNLSGSITANFQVNLGTDRNKERDITPDGKSQQGIEQTK